MKSQVVLMICTGLAGLLIATAAGAYSIPDDQLDAQKIFWGNASAFENPAAVNIDEVVKATPEYDEIKKNKIERGTGKYWILISEATDRAVEAISDVAAETKYDLVAAEGYLDGLSPAVPSVNITNQVLDKLQKD